MKKLSLKLPRISKTVILSTVSVLFVLSLIAYGAVRSEQASRSRAAQAAQAATLEAAKNKADTDNRNRLQAEVNQTTATAKSACSQLRNLQTNKTTAKLVSLPDGCNLPL